MTLTQTKKSLADLSAEMQTMKTIKIKSVDESYQDDDNGPTGKPYMQKINTVRQKYDK